MINPLLVVQGLGQSIWLDYIQRGLLTSGELQRLIDEDGINGVTSNPAIFENAIVEHDDYDAAIAAMPGIDASELYERLAIQDLQQAADILAPCYTATQGRDGFVSFEVSPELAFDTEATVCEARRLWAALDRPNSLIKVPATSAGVKAIQQLIVDGINVNATLLFGLKRYREVAQAYLDGLEIRAGQGERLTSVAAVASFFLSRIDTLVDRKLDAMMPAQEKVQVRGQVAIASARLAYQEYKQLFSGGRWRKLVRAGAKTQRLLWASTSTRDPAYSDIRYIEALIGAETINTLSPGVLIAYRDHGKPAARLEHHIDTARNTLSELAGLGLDLDTLTEQLEQDGVQKFSVAYQKLLANLQRRSR